MGVGRISSKIAIKDVSTHSCPDERFLRSAGKDWRHCKDTIACRLQGNYFIELEVTNFDFVDTMGADLSIRW